MKADKYALISAVCIAVATIGFGALVYVDSLEDSCAERIASIDNALNVSQYYQDMSTLQWELSRLFLSVNEVLTQQGASSVALNKNMSHYHANIKNSVTFAHNAAHCYSESYDDVFSSLTNTIIQMDDMQRTRELFKEVILQANARSWVLSDEKREIINSKRIMSIAKSSLYTLFIVLNSIGLITGVIAQIKNSQQGHGA